MAWATTKQGQTVFETALDRDMHTCSKKNSLTGIRGQGQEKERRNLL